MTCTVGQDGTQHFAVFVAHLLCHMPNNRLVHFFNVDSKMKKKTKFDFFYLNWMGCVATCVLCVDLPVEVGSSGVFIGQLQPGVRHHLVDIWTFVGVRFKKFLQQAKSP